MAASLRDIYKLLDSIDHHARTILAQHTEVRAMIASLQIPDKSDFPCRHCGAALLGERALAFHVWNVHGGPPVPLSAAEEAG